MQLFGSLPSSIIKESNNPFTAGRLTGVHIAALKCLFAFGLKNDFKTKEVSLSLSQLEQMTGLSKPMIINGIKRLIELNVVEKIQQEKTNVPNKYKLLFLAGSRTFTKIPYQHLIHKLATFSNRGVYVLTALKIYLIFLQVRDNKLKEVEISYLRLAAYGINQKHICKALEILIVNNWISVSREMDADGGYTKSCNKYSIKGMVV